MAKHGRGFREPVTDEELNSATSTIERWYHEWARETAISLMHDFFSGEIADRDDFQERLDTVTDDAMIYNVDQSRTLFASSSVDQAMDDLRDMGGGGENAQAALAVLTFRIDVQEQLERKLGGARGGNSSFAEVEDMNEYERLRWLADEYGVLVRGALRKNSIGMEEVYYVADFDSVLLINDVDETGSLVSSTSFIRSGDSNDAAVDAVVAELYKQGVLDELGQVKMDKMLEERRRS